MAGLKPYEENVRIDDNELFADMRRTFVENGGICTRTKFDRRSTYSVDVLNKRFGTWKDILTEFRKWVVANGIDFPYLDALPTEPAQTEPPAVDGHTPEPPELRRWPSGGGTTYGAFLNFRGLQHAPVNEQGVVFLFGMVCSDLGFVVEVVRTGFPDCEAKCCVNSRRNQWERVSIEFEFRASGAKVHKLERCGLVVCWENDWPDCPIEVLELKSAIKQLQP